MEGRKWPYPVRYGKENWIDVDVLVVGGGIAGCHAAISAAKMGVRVAVVEKAATKWSGNGGAGVDHWQAACTNPCCKITPEEMTVAVVESLGGYECGLKRYIQCVEGYETLLEVERMGVKIRDTEDEFKGAEFRDDKTKFLFAYDYENRYTLRVWGYNMKPCLYRELRRLGVLIFDRVMATSILNKDRVPGSPVVGVTGLNVRTGEFYIFRSKALILCIPEAEGLWDLPEPHGFGRNFHDPTCKGDGMAMAFHAGAQLTLLEKSLPTDGTLGYIPYAVGNAHNTWHGCTLIDSQGREISWYDRDGRPITYGERFLPCAGQKFFIDGGSIGDPRNLYRIHPPVLDPKISQKIRSLEYQLPLYADLTAMSEHERKAIFGVMVRNEGKTFEVYNLFQRSGFDPQRHMLRVPIFEPEGYTQHPTWWYGQPIPKLRRLGRGAGVVVDWKLMTCVEGPFAAGSIIFGHGDHAGAATSGRYAGRQAALYASRVDRPEIPEKETKRHKEYIYSFVRNNNGPRWKEVLGGLNRIMQDYCSVYKHERTLLIGLELIKQVKENEFKGAYAPNPHELARLIECDFLFTVGELVLLASIARKASSSYLGFYRIDFPQIDPPEWRKLVLLRKAKDGIRIEDLPLDYYLKAPYASTYKENYERYSNVGRN
ncbi:MAG: FAD-dependent oxidoreductase [Deltaproteobacteria bacterium]|nr:FAD-dependent oxidoreductase [Deltaproteobacteria bacterium]